MAAPRDPMAAVEANSPGVTFEVERFGWTSGGRLEVTGRWFGLRGHRFLRPTLDVEVDGHPRRMLATLDHKPWASDDGEEWVAAFEWKGDRVDLVGAELSVGPDLAVELPPPRAPGRAKRPDGDGAGGAARTRTQRRPVARREAGPPRSSALKGELAAAAAEIERMREETDRTREAHAEEVEDLRARLAAETQAARQLSVDLGAAREHGESAETEAKRRLEQLQRERDGALATRAEAERMEAERDRALREREDALRERDRAAAEREEALRDREDALRRRATAEQELDAAMRARDKARQERNEWLSRARDALAELDAAAAASQYADRTEPSPRARRPAPEPERATGGGEPPIPRASGEAAQPGRSTGGGAAPAPPSSGRAGTEPERATAGDRSPADPDTPGAGPSPGSAGASPPAGARRAGPGGAAAGDPAAGKPPAQRPKRTIRIGSADPLDAPPSSGAPTPPLGSVRWTGRPGARRTVIPIEAPRLLAGAALTILLVLIVVVLVVWVG